MTEFLYYAILSLNLHRKDAKPMKKTLLCLCALCLALLCACGTPAEKNENELMEDFRCSETFQMHHGGDWDITKFEILERRTSSKDGTDTLSLRAYTVDSQKEDPESQQCLLANMEYKLYDNGWFLENIEITGAAWHPLRAPEMGEEAIAALITNRFGGEVVSLQINASKGSLEEAQYSNEVTCMVQHKYMSEALELQVGWSYDEISGYWSGTVNTLHKTEDWSALEGWFYTQTVQRDTVLYSKRFGITNFQKVSYPSDYTGSTNILANIDRVTYNQNADGIEQTATTCRLYEVPKDNFANFVIDTNFGLKSSEVKSHIRQLGYTVSVQGLQLTDFDYYSPVWAGTQLLIGKDHIADGLKKIKDDVSGRRLIYTFEEVELETDSLDILRGTAES